MSILKRSGNDSVRKDTALFESIARDIASQGYSIHQNALPSTLLSKLTEHLQRIPTALFKQAGFGREQNYKVDDMIRTDTICWINGDSIAGEAWLGWAESLQRFINRRLFMGLTSFESHFAHYAQGDFYKKHQDSFKGCANRVLSVVVYLNNDWKVEDGGELIIYTEEAEQHTIKVSPKFGTLAVFLSEEIPHEVLAAKRDRYSIAGWFRAS